MQVAIKVEELEKACAKFLLKQNASTKLGFKCTHLEDKRIAGLLTKLLIEAQHNLPIWGHFTTTTSCSICTWCIDHQRDKRIVALSMSNARYTGPSREAFMACHSFWVVVVVVWKDKWIVVSRVYAWKRNGSLCPCQRKSHGPLMIRRNPFLF